MSLLAEPDKALEGLGLKSDEIEKIILEIPKIEDL